MKMRMIGWLVVSILFSSPTHSAPIGFNQAWFKNHYATQYLDGSFDPTEVERIFSLAGTAGADRMRLWFFESTTFPMLLWENGRVTGIREDYVRNVIRMLELSRLHGIRIYMTLLDSQVYRPDHWREDHSRFRYLLDEAGGEEFLNRALLPLLREISSKGLATQILRVDLANEIDAAVNRLAFRSRWNGVSRFLCRWREAIRSVPGFETLPVSASLRLHALLPLPFDLFEQDGPYACADFYDFHSYSDQGRIHSCGRMRRQADRTGKPFILGEFGQAYFTRRYSDELQIRVTRSYLEEAGSCGFSEAHAWRLSDIRPGENPEARYSFEAFGTTRPAFELIRERNKKPASEALVRTSDGPEDL
jgi:hypothetical protein